MKKLLIIIALALPIGGCAGLQQTLDTIQKVTVGTKNPITKDQLYAAENGMVIAFAGLNAYRRSCVNGAIPDSCKDVIRRMQVYTRRLPAQLAILRRFIKENDTVNASIAYTAIMDSINSYKAIATANNVRIS